MSTRDSILEDKCVIQWIDTMKEKLDMYEVQRNEFLADYKLPPKNIQFYRDIILPFVENPLLTDNIAASENIEYTENGVKNGLEIHVYMNGIEIQAQYPDLCCFHHKPENGKPCCSDITYPYPYPYLTQHKEFSNEDPQHKSLSQALNSKVLIGKDGDNIVNISDIEVCIPSEHAFYSILENFIRNSAKHNKEKLNIGGNKPRNELKINILISEQNDQGTIDPDYYTLTLWDNVSAIDLESLAGMYNKIKMDLVEGESGRVRRENLGVADMKINAHLLKSGGNITELDLKKSMELMAFTRNNSAKHIYKYEDFKSLDLPLDTTSKKTDSKGTKFSIRETIEKFAAEINKHPIIPVPHLPQQEATYAFCYRFKIAKSKKLCWIGLTADNQLKENFRRRGIHLFDSWKDFDENRGTSLAAFQFAILEEDVINVFSGQPENILNEHLMKLPCRILVNTKERFAAKSLIGQFAKQKRLQFVKEIIEMPGEQVDGVPIDLQIMKNCWENWLKRWQINENKKAELIVTSEGNEFPGWADFVDNFRSKIFNFEYEHGEISSLNKNYPKVFYDHHGQGGSRDKFSKSFLDENCFVEFGKSNPDYTLISNLITMHPMVFPYELLEAGLLRVLIVDERMIEFGYQDSGRGEDGILSEHGFYYKHANSRKTTNFDASWAANVFIVTHIKGAEILNKSGEENRHWLDLSFENKTHDLSIRLKTNFTPHSKAAGKEFDPNSLSFDAVILHRTYLNDEYKDSIRCGLEVEEFLLKLRRTIPFVFVNSGGSYPHGIKGIFKFIPFNELRNKFVNGKGIAKLSLANFILSLTQ
jgi:hypothetical protein